MLSCMSFWYILDINPLLQISFANIFSHSLGTFFVLVILKESEVAQSCPTLCDPTGCSLPVFSVHGIFQARVLEWVAISFSRRSSWPRDWTQVSRIIGMRFPVWATREVPQSLALEADALSIRPLGHHPFSIYLCFLVLSIQSHMSPICFFPSVQIYPKTHQIWFS